MAKYSSPGAKILSNVHGLCKRAGKAKAHKHLESGGMHRAVDNDQVVSGEKPLRHLAIKTTGDLHAMANSRQARRWAGVTRRGCGQAGRSTLLCVIRRRTNSRRRRVISLAAVSNYRLYALHVDIVVDLMYTLLSTHFQKQVLQILVHLRQTRK